MDQFIDITDRGNLRALLLALQPQTVPLWGKMKPQQMVEHLISEVKWTNGKKVCTCDRPADEAEKAKLKMIYTSAALPKNVAFTEIPENYGCLNIEAAIDELMKELDDFDAYFKEPDTMAIHGGFGPMNCREWLTCTINILRII